MAKRSSTSARIVKICLDVVLALGGLGAALLALWLVVSPLVMSGPGKYADVSIPVAIGERSVLPVVRLEVTNGGSGVTPDHRHPRIVKGRGELRLETTHWSLQSLSNTVYLFGIMVVLYVVYMLRGVFKTVTAGAPFAPVNSSRLRRIGFVLIGAGIIVPILEYVVAWAILSRVTITGAELSPPVHVDPELVLGGLMLLALATIFRHGAELEQDQSLTV